MGLRYVCKYGYYFYARVYLNIYIKMSLKAVDTLSQIWLLPFSYCTLENI